MLRHLSIHRRPQPKQTGSDLGTCLRDIGVLFLAFLFVVVSLPVVPHAFASDAPSSEVASAQPDETPVPTPTPTEEELKLQHEKAILDLKKGIEEDKKAIADAKYPSPKTTPLAGETKINEGAVIESQMLSYYEVALIADLMVKQITAAKPTVTTLAIYNPNDVNLLLSYKTASSQLKLIDLGYQKLVVDPAPDCAPRTLPEGFEINKFNITMGSILAPKIVESVFGSFVDMTALLRTNVEIKGQTFDLDQIALVSEVFRAVKGPKGISNVSLYYPEAFPPQLASFDGSGSNILGQLEKLNLRRAYTEKLVKALEDNTAEFKKAEAEVKKLKADAKVLHEKLTAANEELSRLQSIYGNLRVPRRKGTPPAIQERMLRLRDEIGHLQDSINELEDPNEGKIIEATNEMEELKAELDCVYTKLGPSLQDPDKLEDTLSKLRGQNQQFASFLDALLKADTSGVNPLTTYLKAEMLQNVLNQDGSYWLQLRILKAGGNNRIKTNLVADIFRGGNRLSHSGGAIVEYILFDRDGRAIKSDSFTAYSDYIKSNKIKALPNPE